MRSNGPSLIGISCELKPPDDRRSFSRKKDILVLNRDYGQAVERAGGLPVAIPLYDDSVALQPLFSRLDGVILSGGDDVIAPAEEKTARRVCLQRSHHESALLKTAVEMRLPILGICRGLQQINVFFGGTLWDDLPAWKPGAVDHRRGKRLGSFRHKITLSGNSSLRAALGADELDINSYHHQAAKEIGKGLQVVALAEDGAIEALVGTGDALIWAVQWHPERMGDHVAGDGLLRAFVRICRERSVSE